MLREAPHLRAYHNWAWCRVEIFMVDPNEKPTGEMLEPIATIPFELAQRLIDDLWAMNLRPTDEGTVGQLQILKEHRDYLIRLLDQILPVALGCKEETDQDA